MSDRAARRPDRFGFDCAGLAVLAIADDLVLFKIDHHFLTDGVPQPIRGDDCLGILYHEEKQNRRMCAEMQEERESETMPIQKQRLLSTHSILRRQMLPKPRGRSDVRDDNISMFTSRDQSSEHRNQVFQFINLLVGQFLFKNVDALPQTTKRMSRKSM